jgi:hypothetical protein
MSDQITDRFWRRYPRLVIWKPRANLLFLANGPFGRHKTFYTVGPQSGADMVETTKADNHMLMT